MNLEVFLKILGALCALGFLLAMTFSPMMHEWYTNQVNESESGEDDAR